MKQRVKEIWMKINEIIQNNVNNTNKKIWKQKQKKWSNCVTKITKIRIKKYRKKSKYKEEIKKKLSQLRHIVEGI